MSSTPPAEPEKKERLTLSWAQVMGGAAASVTAAVICSFFGLAGTVIGTAVTSVCVTIGAAVYSYSLRRGRARMAQMKDLRPYPALRIRMPQGQTIRPVPEEADPDETDKPDKKGFLQQMRLHAVVGAVAAFVIAFAVVTFVELGSGRSLASSLTGDHTSGRTTLSSIGGGGHRSSPVTTTSTPSTTTPPEGATTVPTQTAPSTTEPGATTTSSPDTTTTVSSTTTTAPSTTTTTTAP